MPVVAPLAAASKTLVALSWIALDYRQALAKGRWGDIWNLAPKPGMLPPRDELLESDMTVITRSFRR